MDVTDQKKKPKRDWRSYGKRYKQDTIPSFEHFKHDVGMLRLIPRPHYPELAELHYKGTSNRRELRAALPGYCENKSCEVPLEWPVATLNHIKPRCEKRKHTEDIDGAWNIENLCVDCHWGGNGTIQVPGVPFRVMYQILDDFTTLRISVATPVVKESVFRRKGHGNELETLTRPTVVRIDITGEGVQAFNACRAYLGAIVAAAECGGRMSLRQSRFLRRVAQDRFIIPFLRDGAFRAPADATPLPFAERPAVLTVPAA